MEQRADGTLVIDLLPLAPPPSACVAENPTLSILKSSSAAKPGAFRARIGPRIFLPDVDDFGIGIPRRRHLRLIRYGNDARPTPSTRASEASNANGGEVRLKIDF